MKTIERKTITLACERDGLPVPVEVMAYVCGGLALHKAIGGNGYTVTHMSSSLSLTTGITGPIAPMIATVQELAGLLDWTPSDAWRAWTGDETKQRYLSLIKKLHGGT